MLSRLYLRDAPGELIFVVVPRFEDSLAGENVVGRLALLPVEHLSVADD